MQLIKNSNTMFCFDNNVIAKHHLKNLVINKQNKTKFSLKWL